MSSTILGIFASSGELVATSYDSIATSNAAAGGSAYLDFTTIPGTYAHLQIRGLWLNSVSGTSLQIQFNSDSGAGNYKNHYIYGNRSTASAGVGGSSNGIQIGYKLSDTTTYPDVIIADIFDYANTNKYTTVRSIDGSDQSSSGTVQMQSGLWINTNAITSIRIVAGSGNISQYSTFALYGIKAA